jgi:hypothetical protein
MYGNFILFKAHPRGMQVVQGTLLCALGCFGAEMQRILGSEVRASKSEAGDDHGEQKIVNNHVHILLPRLTDQSRRRLEASVLAFGAVLQISTFASKGRGVNGGQKPSAGQNIWRMPANAIVTESTAPRRGNRDAIRLPDER